MISQHWFRWWRGAIMQQTIIWFNVKADLSRHLASKSVLLAVNNEFVFNIYGVIFQKAKTFTSHISASHLQQRFNFKGAHIFSATSEIRFSESTIKLRIVVLSKPELCWWSLLRGIDRQIGYCNRCLIIPWENIDTYLVTQQWSCGSI